MMDDPVGAVSVHRVCGTWGILAVGLFADGTCGGKWYGVAGLFYSNGNQLAAQVINIFANVTLSRRSRVARSGCPGNGCAGLARFVLAKGGQKETANGELG